MRAAVQHAIDAMVERGAKRVTFAPHGLVDSRLLRDRPGRGFVQPLALRWRALRPPAADYRDLNDMIEKSRAEGFGREVKRRILTGAYVALHGYYDAYYPQGPARPAFDCRGFGDRIQTVI